MQSSEPSEAHPETSPKADQAPSTDSSAEETPLLPTESPPKTPSPEKSGADPAPLQLSVSEKSWRVKLYKLNPDGGWDDLGTGFSSIVTQDGKHYVILISEEKGNRQLLRSQITDTTNYHRQRETIITWSDPETKHDLAVSY